MIGAWDKTYEHNTSQLDNATMTIAFSGWADFEKALQESEPLLEDMVGDKYVSFAGGLPDTGYISIDALLFVAMAISTGMVDEYDGIAFDVEVGDSGLANTFADVFMIAKGRGLKVLVSVSHSAPYGIRDAKELMTMFFQNPNIDYLSPQLYTKGTEEENDYSISMGVSWSEWTTARATIVPSIVQASLYKDAVDFFAITEGLLMGGYIQWKTITDVILP